MDVFIFSNQCCTHLDNLLHFMCSNTDFGLAISGVLTDEQGRVRALWGSFSTQVLTRYSLACLPGLILTFFIGPKIGKTLKYYGFYKSESQILEVK